MTETHSNSRGQKHYRLHCICLLAEGDNKHGSFLTNQRPGFCVWMTKWKKNTTTSLIIRLQSCIQPNFIDKMTTSATFNYSNQTNSAHVIHKVRLYSCCEVTETCCYVSAIAQSQQLALTILRGSFVLFGVNFLHSKLPAKDREWFLTTAEAWCIQDCTVSLGCRLWAANVWLRLLEAFSTSGTSRVKSWLRRTS